MGEQILSLVFPTSLRRTLAALCMAGIGFSGPALAAQGSTRLVIKGRVINTKVEAPQFPSSRAECTQFNEEMGELSKMVSEEHQSCLDDKSNASGGGGTCSKPACQKLHDALDELRTAKSKGFAECNAAVNERQRSERWGSSGHGTDLDEFRSALKAGPVAAVRRLVKQEIRQAIDKTFGFGSPVIRNGLNAGIAANAMVSRFTALQKACEEKSNAALNACNKEMLASIQSLPTLVPNTYSRDPGIPMIQNAMMSRLNLTVRDTLDQMDRLGEQVDDITQERPSSSRRRRAGPLIENN